MATTTTTKGLGTCPKFCCRIVFLAIGEAKETRQPGERLCITTTKSYFRQSKPLRKLQNAIKMHHVFYPNTINTLLVFFSLSLSLYIYIYIYTIIVYHLVQIFIFFLLQPRSSKGLWKPGPCATVQEASKCLNVERRLLFMSMDMEPFKQTKQNPGNSKIPKNNDDISFKEAIPMLPTSNVVPLDCTLPLHKACHPPHLCFLAIDKCLIGNDILLRGWSHRPILTPSVGNSGCNSVKSGGPTSISEHNPQQFHSWNPGGCTQC